MDLSLKKVASNSHDPEWYPMKIDIKSELNDEEEMDIPSDTSNLDDPERDPLEINVKKEIKEEEVTAPVAFVSVGCVLSNAKHELENNIEEKPEKEELEKEIFLSPDSTFALNREHELLKADQYTQFLCEQPTDPVDSDEEEWDDLYDIAGPEEEQAVFDPTQRHLRDFREDSNTDDEEFLNLEVAMAQKSFDEPVVHDERLALDLSGGLQPVTVDGPWLLCQNQTNYDVQNVMPFIGPRPGAYLAAKRLPIECCYVPRAMSEHGFRPVYRPPVREYLPNPEVKDMTPFAVFMLYFRTIMEVVLRETNRYWREHAADDDIYEDITIDQLSRFFAIIIEMGHTIHHSLYDYWSVDGVKHIAWFGRTLPRVVFFHILCFLHFTSRKPPTKEQRQAGHFDRLWKVRDILDLVCQKSRELYNPSQDLAIDEIMSAFKGQVIFKPYIPKKQKRYGVMVYKLTDSSAYTVYMTVYTGAAQELPKNNKTVAEQTVFKLLSGLEHKGHRVFMDKFFTSLSLFRRLKEAGILACGTACPSRTGMPAEFHKANSECINLRPHELACRVTPDGVSCMQFRDKDIVTLMSTIHSATKEGLYNLPGGMKTTPLIITDYNNKMGTVDVADQVMSGYSIRQRTNKWTKKLFFYLFDTLMVNAFIAYNSVNKIDSTNPYRWFRDQVAKDLVLSAPTGVPQWILCDENGEHKRLQGCEGRHFPRRHATSRPFRCTVCRANKPTAANMTHFYCASCLVPLCIAECFERYHTQQNLKNEA